MISWRRRPGPLPYPTTRGVKWRYIAGAALSTYVDGGNLVLCFVDGEAVTGSAESAAVGGDGKK